MASYIVFEVPESDEAFDKQSKTFDCPCCGSTLQFLTRVTISGVRPVTASDGTPLRFDMESQSVVAAATAEEVQAARSNGQIREDGRMESTVSANLPIQIDINKGSPTVDADGKFNADERSILSAAEKQGVLAAFERAIAVSPGSKPGDVKGFFLKFLKGAIKKQKNRLGLEMALANCGVKTKRSDDIELWGFNNICAIAINGVLEVFLPIEFVRGEDIEKMNLGQGTVKKEIVTSGDWLKKGGGYIGKGAGQFAAHLAAKSYGALSGS